MRTLEQIKEYQKQWYEENKDKVNKLAKKEYKQLRKKQLCPVCLSKTKTSLCDACREKRNKYNRSRARRIRDQVYTLLGNICVCCGERENLFLSVDHINNDGAEQRKNRQGIHRNGFDTTKVYTNILKDKPTDIQLLCFNCNLGKARNNGVCPHKEIKDKDGSND